jgi:predicted neuraminidase
MVSMSRDNGATWEPPRRLPDDIIGPVKNKPLRLPDGRILCGSSTEDKGWRVHMEWTDRSLSAWSRTAPLNDGKTTHAIQPTILRHGENRLQILCRSKGLDRVVTAWSYDAGDTWTSLAATNLPNPNSGIDAVTLDDGRHALVYNHTTRGRSPLNIAISADGLKWKIAATLEDTPGEYSYPAVIQTHDGMLHVTYTWKRRRVKHVVLDPQKF